MLARQKVHLPEFHRRLTKAVAIHSIDLVADRLDRTLAKIVEWRDQAERINPPSSDFDRMLATLRQLTSRPPRPERLPKGPPAGIPRKGVRRPRKWRGPRPMHRQRMVKGGALE